MSHDELIRQYGEARASRFARRLVHDDRGAAAAEQIVLVGAAVVGAVLIAGIIWSKLQSGAENIQTPAP